MKKLIVVATALFLTACTLSKPHVGKYVDVEHPSIAKLSSIPGQCEIQTKHYKIVANIKKGVEPGQYILDAIAYSKISKLYSRLSSSDSKFSLLLIKNGTVIDNFTVFPDANLTNTELTLKRKFTTQPFDAITFTYRTKSYG